MSQTELTAEKTSLRKQVQDLLVAEDRMSLAGSLGMFLVGLAWCLGVGIVLASLLWFVVPLGWSWIRWFGIYWLVLIPLLVWHERKNRKDYVVRSLTEDDGTPYTAGEAASDSIKLQAAGFAMLLTWGPRQLLDGFAAIRGRKSGDRSARFKRAAQAVLELGKYSSGVEIKQIMRPPENMPVFIAALDWLDKHDYIGRSSDGERLWLSTIGRKKLTDKGVVLKIVLV
ncbi:hypothetical protein [Humisphaera borealis]|uniref:DUF2207 domain-containing protein n=1 Tax=Humisphaera borealis TaxID=2807512 RepID=A0A7M2WZF2_9BACT|nr:hypothetical protein [Humisphaera borealis]QOV90744.1 hypothetical protein IPV69_05130 [Humisphaera borealis]